MLPKFTLLRAGPRGPAHEQLTTRAPDQDVREPEFRSAPDRRPRVPESSGPRAFPARHSSSPSLSAPLMPTVWREGAAAPDLPGAHPASAPGSVRRQERGRGHRRSVAVLGCLDCDSPWFPLRSGALGGVAAAGLLPRHRQQPPVRHLLCEKTPVHHADVMIDWGDVPTWVGSITTSGALLLGLVVLLRDQTRLRGELISQVSYWAKVDPDGRTHAYVDNMGTLPIKVILLGRDQQPPESIKWRHDQVVQPFTLAEPCMYFVPPGNGFRVTFMPSTEQVGIHGALLYDPLNMTVIDNRGYAWASGAGGWQKTRHSARARRVLAGGFLPVVESD